MSKLFLALFTALCFSSSAFAVATITNGTHFGYNTAEPSTLSNYTTKTVTTGSHRIPGGGYTVTTSTSQITTTVDFSVGWGSSEVTGWDYVGRINGASAIYLGDGWIITCAHVLSVTDYSAKFTLSGSTYTTVEGSITRVGSADLVMAYIGTSIELPALSLSTSSIYVNQTVVLVGYGGGSKSYGVANIALNPSTKALYTTTSISGTSTDYIATSGSTSLVGGDSGGAAFYYDGISKAWLLTGVLEAVASSTSNGVVTYYNYCEDIDTYAGEIQEIMASAVPEPSALILAGAGVGVLCWARRRRKNT